MNSFLKQGTNPEIWKLENEAVDNTLEVKTYDLNSFGALTYFVLLLYPLPLTLCSGTSRDKNWIFFPFVVGKNNLRLYVQILTRSICSSIAISKLIF